VNFILTDRPDRAVGRITLNRPDVRNALSYELRQELIDALAAYAAEEDIRCVILTGGPEVFAAGADLRQLARMGPVDMIEVAPEQYWQAIAAFPKPLIAAVNGLALGGGFELALLADIIVAGESAQFGLPEVKVGLIPGGGGTQRLPRSIGKHAALRYLLTGDTMSADTARALGLVCDIVPDSEVPEAALAIAARIAKRAPLALRQLKEAVIEGTDLPLDAALLIERKALQLLLASEDKAEGISAFLEKRAPVFRGK
jgi:enoyl-CoA hydratase/carnithine racemase